jgi:excisionase family DNA binding protein
MEPLLVTRRDAAAALNVSLRTLDTLVSEGQIPVRRVRRRVMFRPGDLEKFAGYAGGGRRKVERDGTKS